MIPLFSATAANAGLDLLAPLNRVLERSWFILGEEVNGFEREFAAYIGVNHCVGVANGSDALELALRALEIGRGDSVVTVANAGFYSSTAIHAVGADPLYVDIDPSSLTLCVTALKAAIQMRPAAIIVTHLYGQLCSIEEVIRIASAAGIPVIEDCAQAHGARRGGMQAGSFGTIACFSFYPTKNLGALGDGGAVVTQDRNLADRVRQLRQYGWTKKYQVSVAGGRNSRLDEMQAAILRIKLPHLDGWNAHRRSVAQRYNQAFAGLTMQLPPSVDEDYVAHLYVVRVPDRSEFAAALKARNVSTDIHYPVADHQQAAYIANVPYALPVTEAACRTAITLPCFPGMSNDQVQRVIDAVKQYFVEKVTAC